MENIFLGQHHYASNKDRKAVMVHGGVMKIVSVFIILAIIMGICMSIVMKYYTDVDTDSNV